MNDRVLRNVVVGLGAIRQTELCKGGPFCDHGGFSEIMAILCLADDMQDLKDRLSRIVVAYNYQGEPVTAGELQAVGAMAALVKDAMKPNLDADTESTPLRTGPRRPVCQHCTWL